MWIIAVVFGYKNQGYLLVVKNAMIFSINGLSFTGVYLSGMELYIAIGKSEHSGLFIHTFGKITT